MIAAIAAAAAQLVLCTASLTEVRFGSDARAHVEASGTRLHHAHNDTDCAACAGRHLLASTELEAPRAVAFSRSATDPRVDFETAIRAAHHSDTRSRAPPALPA